MIKVHITPPSSPKAADNSKNRSPAFGFYVDLNSPDKNYAVCPDGHRLQTGKHIRDLNEELQSDKSAAATDIEAAKKQKNASVKCKKVTVKFS